MQSRIEIICGPMFSGKTEELIRRLKRLRYSNQDYLLFKPSMDNRYSNADVVSHDKIALNAHPVDVAQDILSVCHMHPQVRVVAIDEAQFFLIKEDHGKNLVKVVQQLKKEDYRVIINGLDMDFQGNPFGLMPQLLAIADDIKKLSSVCAQCGADANMTFRMVSADSVVELGAGEKYQPRCYKHWKEGQTVKPDPEKETPAAEEEPTA